MRNKKYWMVFIVILIIFSFPDLTLANQKIKKIDITNNNCEIYEKEKNNYYKTKEKTKISVPEIDRKNNGIRIVENGKKTTSDSFKGAIWYWRQIDYSNDLLCEKKDNYTTIKTSGCGPTAMAIVASSLKNKKISPIETSSLCCDLGVCGEGGTSPIFFYEAADHYGFKIKGLMNDEIDEMLPELKKGNSLAIVLVKKGIFTKAGHYIAITSAKGKEVYVHDPNYYHHKGTQKYWNIDVIKENNVKRSYPTVWVISR